MRLGSRSLGSIMLGTILGSSCPAGSVPAKAAPMVGTGSPAPIEPAITRPAGTPCAVRLFSNATFGADTVSFAYAPPAACPGPWAKVVLTADISVTAGRQFDRTASMFIGGVNVLFGTTSEPRSTLAPAWHVERDLTDDTALLRTAQSGHVLIANYQTSVYTSAITASSTLLFYPATKADPAPETPDLVIPLNNDPSQGTTDLADETQSLSRTGILPSNVEKARIDVLLQSQGGDEFWYTCVPDALSGPLETCGGGAFREGLISIDGVKAGVAPVYPWIYTGGIDPYLWQPIPGVQTLAFHPTSVDLTPFAGVVDDGRPHTVSLSVTGADNRFSVTGTLYLTLDHHGSNLRGAVTRNTLGAASPVVTNGVVTTNGESKGTITTGSTHDYAISGYLLTSHGPVVTTVEQTGRFSNAQTFDVTDLLDDQAILQRTDTVTTVTTKTGSGSSVVARASSYPLDVHFRYLVAADGSATQATTVTQALESGRLTLGNGIPVTASAISETVSPSDLLSFNAAGAVTAHSGSSSARYLSGDTKTGCITRTETATDSVLSTMTNTNDCDPGGRLPRQNGSVLTPPAR
ncbi:peptide-N(4)-(N-acetyl-beta-glucosaminyl)asparagine amidase [Lichenicola cladoniae]|uniref:Peptide-N(4)-(N-acetyl-beta-glucosaminyl)asparagine amidase n=1 Tax=Lichenicola cladoniae TaxID=1484109 RepID=A0A6M8HS34_9PROT|nr:peptide-N4-asparagine amidase [Lichenicola cladoniae]NPD65856.1 peptide-N(4)-(N-acetyl-beta-glucosaminyl)asparagine amidase [Acetobacteraceae bacterium]QKE91142.1 peptide-N(4)-(N-acetyl-beta-glucosaminyl)asparagine amidase [Lichenicola cladoniae]